MLVAMGFWGTRIAALTAGVVTGVPVALVVSAIWTLAAGRGCPAFPDWDNWSCFEYWLARYQSLIGALLAVAAALVGAFLLWRQIEIARQAYVTEHRTWLRVYPIALGPIWFEGDRIRVSIGIEAKNVGRFAAHNVQLFAEPYRGHGVVAGTKGIIDQQIAFSKHIAAEVGSVLLAEDTTAATFTADARIDAEAEERADRLLPPRHIRPRAVQISIAYGVVYKSVASEDWRHTAHFISLRKIDGGEIDPALGDVESSNLRAIRLSNLSDIA